MEATKSIVRLTQKNAMLGFLTAALIVVGVLAGVVGYLYLDLKKISEERIKALHECSVEKKQIEADFRAYLIESNTRKEQVVKQTDSLIQVIQKK